MMKVGIVGFPNAGKSTLFNILAQREVANIGNYPFCTIQPNVFHVPVPNERLYILAKEAKSKNIIPTEIKFVDIAGLIKGASTGAGKGNQFLDDVRDVDLIIHLVRAFEDENVMHVENRINPLNDVEIIEEELRLADLSKIDEKKHRELYNQIINGEEITAEVPGGMKLISTKPVLYVVNTSADMLNHNYLNRDCINISIKEEYEMALKMDIEDKKLMMEMLNIQKSPLEKLIQKSYEMLGLITFFTVGPQEARAWSLKNGSTVQEAAGKIHSDIAKNFIKAEVRRNLNDNAKIEGKDYIVKNEDILFIHFR